MSTLTSELNLAQAQDGDDTADYLTLPSGLSGNMATIDGLFNATSGHSHNGAHQGATLGPNAFADNTIPGAKLVDGSVTAAKLAPGVVPTIESIFVGSTVVTAVNYVVAAGVMFVFCNASVTVTLPAAASTSRPITVCGNAGLTITVNAAGGTVYGGSANQTTGAVQNGIVGPGEAFTWKSDGTNYRAI